MVEKWCKCGHKEIVHTISDGHCIYCECKRFEELDERTTKRDDS